MHIKKDIELSNTGHTNSAWVCDFKTVNLTALPNITVLIRGYKDETCLTKEGIGSVWVTLTSSDLELNGSIGYSDIPKLYEVLTTEMIANPSAIDTDELEMIPAYPDFYGGEIVSDEN